MTPLLAAKFTPDQWSDIHSVFKPHSGLPSSRAHFSRMSYGAGILQRGNA